MYWAISIIIFIIGVVLMVKTEYEIIGAVVCTIPLASFLIISIIGAFKTKNK